MGLFHKVIGKHTGPLGLFNCLLFTLIRISQIEIQEKWIDDNFSDFVLIQKCLLVIIIISLFIRTNNPSINIGVVLLKYLDLSFSVFTYVLPVYVVHGEVTYLGIPIIIILVIFLMCCKILLKYINEGGLDWLYRFSGRYFTILAIITLMASLPISIQLAHF